MFSSVTFILLLSPCYLLFCRGPTTFHFNSNSTYIPLSLSCFWIFGQARIERFKYTGKRHQIRLRRGSGIEYLMRSNIYRVVRDRMVICMIERIYVEAEVTSFDEVH